MQYARSVEKERGKNFRFTLTTNGMLIDDDVIDFANREMSNVVLSLDGRKEINDQHAGGLRGQRAAMTASCPNSRSWSRPAAARTTICAALLPTPNPDFTNDVFHMADLGFTELSMEPVVCAPDDPAALTRGGSGDREGAV